MELHGPLGDVQLVGDLLVGQILELGVQYLPFALAEAGGAGWHITSARER